MKVSVITPSYNQAAYIERTIQSVLAQKGNFELDYRVVDGGSMDGTLEILKKYESRIQWTSEPDRGQSDALNKGLRLAGGEILAWLNSDDLYQPDALARVVEEYRRQPFAWCFGDCRIIDEEDHEIRKAITRYKMSQSSRYSYSRLLRRDFISQPAAFFTAEAFRRAGDIDCGLHYSMDYDYWLRLGRLGEPRYLNSCLAAFRWHTHSKNGTAYRSAAWESWQTARRHARGRREKVDVAWHFLHYCALCVVYRFL